MKIRNDANQIMKAALKAALPDVAVKNALEDFPVVSGKVILVAIGKAAWQMAHTAYESMPESITDGIVITKYGHSKGKIGSLKIREAGHPVPDKASFLATQEAIDLVENLGQEDMVLFLISGGGSALFEKPLIAMDEIQDITKQLLSSGADITEINTIRKRLSGVKGGKFAQLISPAKVYSIILSDVLGDVMDMIASGPAYPDSSTCEQALHIVEKYQLEISSEAKTLLEKETPKKLEGVESCIAGSVKKFIEAASKEAESLGYRTVVLTDRMCCEAKEAGSFLASIARYHAKEKESLCILAGGETVVHVTGKGLGGRNQEVALSAAKGISGLENVLVFSLGSDGTDGPCDAAGGIVDGGSEQLLLQAGKTVDEVLENNDAYHALKEIDGLIVTGPTGTNVNDLSCVLIRK